MISPSLSSRDLPPGTAHRSRCASLAPSLFRTLLALSCAWVVACAQPQEVDRASSSRFADLESHRPGESRWDGTVVPQYQEPQTPLAPAADPPAASGDTLPTGRGLAAEGPSRRSVTLPGTEPKPSQSPAQATDAPVPAAPASPLLGAAPEVQADPPATAPPDPSPGQVVAEMEWPVGSRRQLVLHGTLPVPADFSLGAAGRTPLALRWRGSSDEPVPAQVTLVTRSATGAASVVEVQAPMEVPARLRVGSRQRLEVLHGDFALPEPAASTWPTGDNAPYLSTEDVFGNRYHFVIARDTQPESVSTVRVLQSGPASQQWRTAGVFWPTESSEASTRLPHMMGVQAYVTDWGGSSHATLDLRIHNGVTAGSGERTARNQPLGTVYWKSIDLHLPPGWISDHAVRDPFLGAPRSESDRNGWTVRSLVSPMEDGTLHMMGPQAQFVRRMTVRLQKEQAPKREGAFIEGLCFAMAGPERWSWNSIPAYFAQRGLLPNLGGIRSGGQRGVAAWEARLLQERDLLLGPLRSGRPNDNPVRAAVMGWSHPEGYPHGYAVGGLGIPFLSGHRTAYAASHVGYERIELLHRMNVARQPDAQYAENGDPIGVAGWLDERGAVPFDFRQNGFMVPPEFQFVCKGGPAPSAHVLEVARRGLRPPYDPGNPHEAGGALPREPHALLAWMGHDDQHMIRYSKNHKALVWLGNDPLAKDGLFHVASLFHLWFHNHPHQKVEWSHGVTLRTYLTWARAHPGHGLPMGREHAWGLDAMSAAYQLADDAWRAEALPWFQKVVELFQVASMPNGLVHRVNLDSLFGGRYDAAQTYQLMFLMHAQRAMNESVFREAHLGAFQTLAELHNRGLDYLFFGPVFTHFQGERYGQRTSVRGPYHRFAVGPKGGPGEPPFCDAARWGPNYLPEDGFGEYVDTAYLWAPLEYGFWLTRDPQAAPLDNRYLRRTLEIGSAPGRVEKLAEEFWRSCTHPVDDNTHNLGTYIGTLQALGLMDG